MTFDEVESKRKLYVNKRTKARLVCLGAYLGLLAVFILFHVPIIIEFSMVFILVAVIIVNATTKNERNDYIKSYKSHFVAKSLAEVFTNITYDHNLGMPRETIRKAMTTADGYSSNDLVVATYRNIGFTQADVEIVEKHNGDGGGKTYSTVFGGRFLVFDFNRNFTTNLQVASYRFNGAQLSHSSNNYLHFERIETESDEFNKNFYVYAEDSVDALYILDPAFMEKIQRLYQDCGHEILLTFIDKKVYIAIDDRKDSLEPPRDMRKPLNEKIELEKVKKDILVITNFVDSLNLDCYFKGGQK